MNLNTFIGLRYAGAKRRNQLVSFISGISIFGMAVSVALLVVVLSVMNGFDKELRERILTLMPQGAIYHRQGVSNWQDLRKTVVEREGIIEAAPFVQLTGMVTYKRNVGSMLMYGVDPEYQSKVSTLDNYLPASLLELLQPQNNVPAIILGDALAEKLSADVGKQIRVVLPANNAERRAEIATYVVSAIVKTGTEADQHLSLVHIKDAQALAELGDRVTGVWVTLVDIFAAPRVMYDTVLALADGYTNTDWTRSQGNIYQAIQMSKKLVSLLLILIIGIAAFNVVSTLVMVTVDKQSDIAILRTLGASTQRIMGIFMVQGTLIGIIGTTLGLIAGVILASFVQEFVAWLEALIGYQFLKSDVYPISFVPEDIRLTDLISIAVTALILSFLATLYPAWRASKVKPAEALRYEI